MNTYTIDVNEEELELIIVSLGENAMKYQSQSLLHQGIGSDRIFRQKES